MMKAALRRWLPDRIYGPIRAYRVRRFVAGFEPRQVAHTYAGYPLTVQLADPLGEFWYDHDWDEPAEIFELRRGRLCQGASVLDVGAHQAVVAMILARIVGVQGAVVAVEAEPHNARIASQNVIANAITNVTVVHAAASDRPGMVSFAEGLNGNIAREGIPGSISVPAITVDEMALLYGCPDVVFIDVEGHEARVLRGASSTIAGGETDFFVELHDAAALAAAGSTADEVLAHFGPETFEVCIAQTDNTPPGVASSHLLTDWEPPQSALHREGRRCFVVARPLEPARVVRDGSAGPAAPPVGTSSRPNSAAADARRSQTLAKPLTGLRPQGTRGEFESHCE